LKNKFGYDEAINYKEEQDLNAALKRSVCNHFAVHKFWFNMLIGIKKYSYCVCNTGH